MFYLLIHSIQLHKLLVTNIADCSVSARNVGSS